MTKRFLILCILLLSRYASVSQTLKEEEQKLQVVYTVDGEGIFLYDFKSGQDKKIYNSRHEFMRDQLSFINDSTVLAGYQDPSYVEHLKRFVYSKYLHKANGDSMWMTDHPPFILLNPRQRLSQHFFAISLDAGTNYKYKTMDFDADYPKGDTLRIRSTFFDQHGDTLAMKDTMLYRSKITWARKGMFFLGDKPYKLSEAVKGRQAFSRDGDLYVVDQQDTILFLKFGGVYDSEYGNGYCGPELSPDGKRVAFESIDSDGSPVLEMELLTKKKTKLAGKEYYHPLYSPGGKKVLLFKDTKKPLHKNDIYVLDIASGKLKKIGQGNDYRWRPKR